ncbi:MAG TPA: GNVR domain-containing protein [Candidatus Dormibacteraeota bacterium]|nr:GNVR domain-containing protein [Candidatus Dormibacteraeota bacterium]
MSDLPAKPVRNHFEPRQPDELGIEAIDEQSIQEARERRAARALLLWNRRRFLLWAFLGGLVVAGAIAFLIPKSYQSTARLMPPDQGSGVGASMLAALSNQVGSGLTSLAESALGTKTNGDLFLGILESETVRDDLIHKFHLQQLYHDRYIEDARKDLAKHTSISADSKTGIISITVTDHDPKRAAAMAQEYVNELNWVTTHLNTSSAHRERVFLDQRLRQVKTSLESAEKRFSQFASQKGAIDIPEQGKAMVEAAAKLQGQLIAAQSELNGFRQIYTDNNVRVRSLQARVDELRSSLEKIAGKNTDQKSSARQIYPSLRELPLLGVTYADLLRQMKVEEAVFETLTEEDELAKVQEAKEVPSVKVLDPPLVPDRKSFPPRGLIMALGAMLSFVFGAAWILAGSAWEAVDPNDPRKAAAIVVWSDVHSSLPWGSRNGSSNGKAKTTVAK